MSEVQHYLVSSSGQMSLPATDDHLLGDLLSEERSPGLEGLPSDHEPATTNLY